jgi:hypothetical protein
MVKKYTGKVHSTEGQAKTYGLCLLDACERGNKKSQPHGPKDPQGWLGEVVA